MGKSELYDCNLVLHHATLRAYGVSETGDPEKIVWLPKSQVERNEKTGDHKIWPIYSFTMPEWLAIEKGLV